MAWGRDGHLGIAGLLVASFAPMLPGVALAADSAALFVIAKGGRREKLVTAVVRQVVQFGHDSGVAIVSGTPLKKRIKKRPMAAIQRCGSNLGCIAKLGKSARANKVLLTRVTETGSGISVQMLLINVNSASLENRAMYHIDRINDTAQLEVGLYDLFRIAKPAPSADADMSLALAPLVPLAPPESPGDPSNGDSSAPPEGEPEPPLDALELEMPAVDLAALPPAPREDPGVAGSQPLQIGTVGYGGVAVAGIGLIGVVIGSLYGAKAKSLPGRIDRRGSDGDSQLEAERTYANSHDAVGKANTWFGIGGLGLAVGVGLLATDLFVLEHETVTASAEVGSGSVRGTIAVHW